MSYQQADDVHALTTLIAHATLAVSMRANPDQAALDVSIEMVIAANRRPAEAARAIDNHTVLFAHALKHCDIALNKHQREAAMKFVRVVGVMLPDIRDDLARALENRRARPTP